MREGTRKRPSHLRNGPCLGALSFPHWEAPPFPATPCRHRLRRQMPVGRKCSEKRHHPIRASPCTATAAVSGPLPSLCTRVCRPLAVLSARVRASANRCRRPCRQRPLCSLRWPAEERRYRGESAWRRQVGVGLSFEQPLVVVRTVPRHHVPVDLHEGKALGTVLPHLSRDLALEVGCRHVVLDDVGAETRSLKKALALADQPQVVNE